MWEQLGEQVRRQWEKDLSEQPFYRVNWFSKGLVVSIELPTPLSQATPLWKRSSEELREVHLCGYRPEELREKLARYWRKPWWVRCFIFGITRQIDVWNYYQRCLAYQAVYIKDLSFRIETEVVTDKALTSRELVLFEAVAKTLYHWHREFEDSLVKCCRRKSWFKGCYEREIVRYQKGLRKRFFKALEQELKDMPREEQEKVHYLAEQGYQMFERQYWYYCESWLERMRCAGIAVEEGEEYLKTSDRRELVVKSDMSVRETHLSERDVSVKVEVRSSYLSTEDGGKAWCTWKRVELEGLLVEGEGSDESGLSNFLSKSLSELKDFIDRHFRDYELVWNSLGYKHSNYRESVESLERFQCQLKQLLQNGMRLFHPDHVAGVVRSVLSWQLLSQYAQKYIEGNRVYLGRLKKYQERFEARLSRLDPGCSFDRERQEYTDWLARFMKELSELEATLEAKLVENDLMRTRDKEELEAKLAESDLIHTRDKEELEAKLVESDLIHTRDKEKLEAKLAESDLIHTRDKEKLETKLVENKRVIETKLVDFSEFFLMKLKEVQEGGLTSNSMEGAVGGYSAFFRGPSDMLVKGGENAVNNQEPRDDLGTARRTSRESYNHLG